MTSKKTEKPRIDLSKMEEFLNGIDKAVQQQFNSVSPQAIVDSIIKDFMSQRAEVVSKLMGFEGGNSNRWNIDHCNGRAGNSPIGDWISEAFSEQIKPIIMETFNEMLADGFKDQVKRKLKEELNSKMSWGIRNITDDLIKEVARDVARDNVDELKEFIKNWMLKKNDLLEK
jgi:hypothetical protein